MEFGTSRAIAQSESKFEFARARSPERLLWRKTYNYAKMMMTRADESHIFKESGVLGSGSSIVSDCLHCNRMTA